MKVYTGTSWVDAGSAVNGTAERYVYTATASQTTFDLTYDVGFVDVYLNGVKQVAGTDFTASSGTNIVLAVGATAGDIVDIVAYGAFNVANTYTQAAADAKFAQVANNLSDLANASTARVNLGVAIGSDVQAYDATIVVDADIGVNVQAYDATLLNDADIGSTVQAYDATIVVDADIGSTVQAYDSNLTSFVSTFTLPTTDGSDNQLLKTNGSGTLSFVTPAPGAGVATATASGALANGDLVVVNADGTVSVVAGSLVPESAGTAVVFESANSEYTSATYDSNTQKVVIAYRDDGNSNRGTAIVGTVSGTSISFGTAVVFESATSNHISATYDANAQKVVIAYQDAGNSNRGTAIVGTVSGTSISFGTAVVFESANSLYISATYDANAQKVVIAYQDAGNSNYGTAIVGTVSGTSISFGTAVVFESATSSHISAVYNANAQRVVIAYRDGGNSNYGTAIVGTVSGTSISFGTAVVFESANSEYISATYDANAQKVVIAYGDGGNSYYGTAIVGTVSGTSISFGTVVVFESARSEYITAVYNANAQRVVIAYRDEGNSDYGTAIVGTVSGTSISFGTAVVFESANSLYISATYDANAQKVVIAYRDVGNSGYGTSVVFQNAYVSTNLTATNYIGISDAVYSDTATATIQTVGSVDDAQSSLTAGTAYYVQRDGTLATTADTISVLAGTALSATKLIIKG
jgi:hypothetical protein